MKDKNTIIIIDMVLIIVAMALAIFFAILVSENKEENNKNSNLNFITEEVSVNIDDTLMEEYVGDELGISFKYYNDLTKFSETKEETSIYQGVAMYQEEGNEGINVLIGNAPDDITLDSYINANISAIMDSNNLTKDDIVVIKEGVKLGGVDAYKVRFKMDDINIYQIATIKGSKEYVVTYSAEDLLYDKQRAENMFSTFEFLE